MFFLTSGLDYVDLVDLGEGYQSGVYIIRIRNRSPTHKAFIFQAGANLGASVHICIPALIASTIISCQGASRNPVAAQLPWSAPAPDWSAAVPKATL